jgi:histidine triad (HIT) family protein
MSAMHPGCIFCDIAAGAAPAHVVDRNDVALAILDINPLARGHCLVIPRRHVPWWHDLSPAELDGVFRLAQETARRMMRVLKPEFVAMYLRGRRIPHTHVFLVPTGKGDPVDRFFNALEGFQEGAVGLAALHDGRSLAEAAELLRRA